MPNPAIRILHLMPDDVIVASHSGQLSNHQLQQVQRAVSARFPNNQVLVHDTRVSLSVHRQPPAPRARRTPNPDTLP